MDAHEQHDRGRDPGDPGRRAAVCERDRLAALRHHPGHHDRQPQPAGQGPEHMGRHGPRHRHEERHHGGEAPEEVALLRTGRAHASPQRGDGQRHRQRHHRPPLQAEIFQEGLQVELVHRAEALDGLVAERRPAVAVVPPDDRGEEDERHGRREIGPGTRQPAPVARARQQVPEDRNSEEHDRILRIEPEAQRRARADPEGGTARLQRLPDQHHRQRPEEEQRRIGVSGRGRDVGDRLNRLEQDGPECRRLAVEPAGHACEKHGGPRGEEERHEADREGRIAEEQPAQGDRPRHHAGVIEIAPVEVAGIVPVVRLLRRGRKEPREDRPHDGHREQPAPPDRQAAHGSSSRGSGTVFFGPR